MKEYRSRAHHYLRPLQLTAVVFFAVSGGPYGLEPLLSYTGSTIALLLVIVTPIVWCIPTILMVLELNSMMPKNGGYYQWVKNALGIRWGFIEGWWSWLYAFVDSAIYPVLFVEYLSFLFPSLAPMKYAICLVFIWSGALLNILGIVPVGRSSVVLGIAVLIPFLILFWLVSFPFNSVVTAVTHFPIHTMEFSGLGMGVLTVMWNFLGWDNATPYVEEVETPVRSYLIAVVGAFLLIVAVYVFAILAATRTGINFEVLQAEGYPSLGVVVGGWWLGAALSVGGMASALGLFLSILLSISRVPKAMADDGVFPRAISYVNPRFNTPHISIIICAIVVSGMVLWGLGDLLVIDVTLYSFGLMLEFVSLIVLRIREPNAERPFKIRLRLKGLLIMTTLPLLCVFAALISLMVTANHHTNAAWFAVAAILSGPFMWFVVDRWGATREMNKSH
jgi:amino acid transporter